jgi:CRP-like cAMP-binding protein
MSEPELQQIKRSLDRIAKILAGLLLRDIEDGEQKQKISRLAQCGFNNVEIADMLGTTRNTVAVALHSLRRHRKRKQA